MNAVPQAGAAPACSVCGAALRNDAYGSRCEDCWATAVSESWSHTDVISLGDRRRRVGGEMRASINAVALVASRQHVSS